MNQRINELINQAGFVRFSPEEDPLTPIDWSCDYTKEVEEFAKLLIAECIVALAPDLKSSEDVNYINSMINKLKQHFGVEE